MGFLPVIGEFLSTWSSTVISGLLIPLILYLAKKIQSNGDEDRNRMEQMKALLAAQLESFRKEIEAQLQRHRDELEKRIDEHSRRLIALEMDSVKKDEYYRENSGWRSEINRLSDQLTTILTAFNDKVIDLWKGKTNEN